MNSVQMWSARVRRACGFWETDRSTDWIGWGRTISILAVIAIHTFGYNAVVEGARGTGIGRVAVVVDAVAVFCVPVFVMISGSLLLDPAKYRGWSSYLKRRLGRLIPALLFWQVFYWGFRNWPRNEHVSAEEYFVLILKGTSYQALYYFWVIVGLVLVGSALIPWIATVRSRAVLVAGIAMAAMPVLTMLTTEVRESPVVWIQTPWTWWTFYLGLYILGWALRRIVVRGVALFALVLVVVVLAGIQAFLFGKAGVDSVWIYLTGGSIYSLGTHIYAVAVFVLMHSLLRQRAPLSFMIRGVAGRLGARLGASTLGVYGLHSALTWVLAASGVLGSELAADNLWRLLARYVAAVVVSFAIVVPLRSVPYISRVL